MVVDEDDVELIEFLDEIEEWVIEEFVKIGLDIVKSILKYDVEDLVRRMDLEEEMIFDVMKILKEEFDSQKQLIICFNNIMKKVIIKRLYV